PASMLLSSASPCAQSPRPTRPCERPTECLSQAGSSGSLNMSSPAIRSRPACSACSTPQSGRTCSAAATSGGTPLRRSSTPGSPSPSLTSSSSRRPELPSPSISAPPPDGLGAACPDRGRCTYQAADRLRGHGSRRSLPGWVRGPIVGQHAIYILVRPPPVVAVEQVADRFDHPLSVAGVQVQLANQLTMLVRDGDRCLDRARRDSLALQAQTVESEGGSGLLAGRARWNPENACVVPAAADAHHLLLLPRATPLVHLTVAHQLPIVTTSGEDLPGPVVGVSRTPSDRAGWLLLAAGGISRWLRRVAYPG